MYCLCGYWLWLKMTCCVSCTGLQSFLDREEIPVDVLVIKPHVKKDRRHASKPDTAYLLSSDNPSSLSMYGKTFSFVIRHNPIMALLFLFLLLLIISPFLFILLWYSILRFPCCFMERKEDIIWYLFCGLSALLHFDNCLCDSVCEGDSNFSIYPATSRIWLSLCID